MKHPDELWKLSPDEFNKWRAENDLPRLFDFFKKSLPNFEQWLQEFDFNIEFFLKTQNPGQLFHGENEKLLLILEEEDSVFDYLFIDIESRKIENEIIRTSKKRNNKYLKFTPYLLWRKRKYKEENFIPTKYTGKVNTLIYTTGTAPDVPEICSWTLLSGFTVLKLGGVKIKQGCNINKRNLDFTNLDFLEIEGKYHGNNELNIFFSHCHNIKINNCELDFINFIECDIMKFNINNSNFTSSAFINGNLWQFNSENSRILNLVFYETSLGSLNLNNTKLEFIEYYPPKNERHCHLRLTYESISKNYKSLRVAYSKLGDRKNVKDCYYNERLYELKKKKVSFEFKSSLRNLFRFRIKQFYTEFKTSLKTLISYLVDFLGYSLWGWGEKPNKLLLNSFLVILIYSLIYLRFDILENYSFSECLYFSIFTFTRLGFNKLPEVSDSIKLLIGTEALMGWIMIGLIISGYVNKLKY
jgi:hypothetical protein